MKNRFRHAPFGLLGPIQQNAADFFMNKRFFPVVNQGIGGVPDFLMLKTITAAVLPDQIFKKSHRNIIQQGFKRPVQKPADDLQVKYRSHAGAELNRLPDLVVQAGDFGRHQANHVVRDIQQCYFFAVPLPGALVGRLQQIFTVDKVQELIDEKRGTVGFSVDQFRQGPDLIGGTFERGGQQRGDLL